ncbi:MAG: ribosomal RNA small subunit methyltransferase A [Anaerolineae bacterium]|nr:ribosomal RNA small subunit methyltransferase A [Anaerolineae bacterium]MCA9894143.1 ribosomal RNA small subunit methyltransferase A [Anaerolineae bacterium]
MNPRELLDEYGVTPKKSLGQNFMHDPNTIEKIVATARLMPDDTVIEVGPGTGQLTAELAKLARHVIAVEVDERMQPILEDRFADTKNVYFVYQDILKTDVLKLVGMDDFVVVANVPYYITTAIISHLLENYRRPRRLVITMQYEVAQRIIAPIGDMSVLAVSVQFYGKPNIVSRLKPAVFWPRPNIDSAILVVECYERPAVEVPSDKAFFKVVRAGFSQKRKQLRNSLSSGLGISSTQAGDLLDKAHIEASRRAETLTLQEWADLTQIAYDELGWE